MYTCLQHIWYKLCTIITNLLDRSSIGPRGPSLAMTSTISMNNGVNALRIMVREHRGKPQNLILNFMRSIEFLLIKKAKSSNLSTKKLSLKLDKNCLSSLALICCTSKTKLNKF